MHTANSFVTIKLINQLHFTVLHTAYQGAVLCHLKYAGDYQVGSTCMDNRLQCGLEYQCVRWLAILSEVK